MSGEIRNERCFCWLTHCLCATTIRHCQTSDLQQSMQAQEFLPCKEFLAPIGTSLSLHLKPAKCRVLLSAFCTFVPPLEQTDFLLAVWGGGGGEGGGGSPSKWCWMYSSAPTTGLQAAMMSWHIHLSDSNCTFYLPGAHVTRVQRQTLHDCNCCPSFEHHWQSQC